MTVPFERSERNEALPLETLAYDDLARAYREGLVTRLRGFQVGPEFLDAWVDDEDAVKAVFDVFDAARAHGLSGLRVTLGAVTVERFDRARFEAAIARIGSLSSPDALTLEVRFGGAVTEAAPREVERVVSHEADHVESSRRDQTTLEPFAWTVGEVYSAAVNARGDARSHQGSLSTHEGAVTVSATAAGVTLRAAVDPRDHRVREARYDGASTVTERGLLETLCAVIEGTSLRDASDHAVIRVESALRDRAAARPVAGIVLPENAAPAFRPLLALTRGLLADYRAQGHDPGQSNFDAPAPSAAWMELDAVAQAEAVQRALDAAMTAKGFEAGAAQCLRVQQGERVTLAFSDAVPSAVRPSTLMALEAALKARVEPALHVYLEERKDLNKLRRL